MIRNLIGSLAAGLLLCGCARAPSYFDAHPQERARVLERCATGAVRGEVCSNALASTSAAQHKDAEAIFRSMSERS